MGTQTPALILLLLSVVLLVVVLYKLGSLIFGTLLRKKLEHQNGEFWTILVSWQQDARTGRVKGHVVRLGLPSEYPDVLRPEEILVFVRVNDSDDETWAARPIQSQPGLWAFERLEYYRVPSRPLISQRPVPS